MINRKYVPLRGVFETTLACNLHCRHCGSSAGTPRTDELSTVECTELFAQLARLGMRWLTLSGGEPTARPDWPELIANAAGTGIRVGMITNAVSLDRQAIRHARQCGLSAMGFSLDGLAQTHDRLRGRTGHWDLLMTAVDDCRSEDMPFAFITTLTPENLGELEALHTHIHDIGAYGWQVQLGSDMGNLRHCPEMRIPAAKLPDVERQVAALIRRSSLKVYPGDSLGYFGPSEKTLRTCSGGNCFGGCAAGIRNIGIESNGNIKGCLSILPGHNDDAHPWIEGNIRQETLETIWNRPGAFAWNREWTPEAMTGFCAECRFVSRCRGGCMGKRAADGHLGENRFCVYRIDREIRQRSWVAAKAAAILTGALAISTAACDTVDEPDPPNPDTETADTATDSSTHADPVPMYAVPEYGVIDTDPVDEYGLVDTETWISLYDMAPLEE